jgi:hypothetical protein
MVLGRWMKKRGKHDREETEGEDEKKNHVTPEHSDASDRREAEITNESNSERQDGNK